jgi:hypothetical protein
MIAPLPGHQEISAASAHAETTGTSVSDAELEIPVARRRRSLWVMAGLIGVAVVGLGIVAAVALNTIAHREENLRKEAHRDYDQGKYSEAYRKFARLFEEFPSSAEHSEDQFLYEFSELRGEAQNRENAQDVKAAKETVQRFQEFLKARKNEPPMKSHLDEVAQTFLALAGPFVTLAEHQHDPALAKQADELLHEAGVWRSKSSTPDPRAQELQQQLAEVRVRIEAWQKRQTVLTALAALKPSVDKVKEARAMARQAGLDQDPEVRELIMRLEAATRQLVRYERSQTQPPKVTPRPTEPSILVAPLLAGAAQAASKEGQAPFGAASDPRRVVPVLARGLLYALDPRDGRVRWATRVGIDTTRLPVRLPVTPYSPELFLVQASRGSEHLLMALRAQDGSLVWQHQLDSPSLGRPVVVKNLAYVPTYGGKVQEIEIAQGTLLGAYHLGQPLSVGGVYQEDTNLLYIPGDSDFVYVLDLAKRECVTTLRTGHPSGSLRSEPIIVTQVDPAARASSPGVNWPSYLILSQADGIDHMRLRVFGLPIQSAEAPPLLVPEPRVRGWSWFEPYHDFEKLAFITDEGALGLFGINQVRNEDPPLFPQLKEEERLTQSAGRLGRAQVVHAVEDDFWVVANGDLQRLHFDVFHQRLVPLWAQALHLGSPIHAGQVDETGKTLFVVTQDLERGVYLATAVDAEDGTIRWQRQLGVELQGEPILLGQTLVGVDRGGGLLRFPAAAGSRPGRAWQLHEALAAQPLSTGAGIPYLVPAGDGSTLYEIAEADGGRRLIVRRCRMEGEGASAAIEERSVDLQARLAGAPALAGNAFLLLLANGTVARLALDGSALAGGPNWRSPRADEDAPGFIVAVNAEEFLTSDGSRGLTRWRWPANDTFRALPEDRQPPTVELPARIIAAPVVLPGTELRVAVADSENRLTLLEGPELKTTRVWPLQGPLSAGPFLRGDRLGCVVDRRRLVWIDPGKEKPMWEYSVRGDGEGIVGQPQLVGDVIVVADSAGRFIGLDPQTGQPRGPGYTLQANAAPVVAPVPFGPEEAFVPLTDGTVFLLRTSLLRAAKPPSP